MFMAINDFRVIYKKQLKHKELSLGHANQSGSILFAACHP